MIHENSNNLDDREKPSISVDIKSKEQKKLEETKNNVKFEDFPKENTPPIPEEEQKPSEDTKTPKEKQCWNLYCKMIEQGINVSFDTLLRGMLIPTEYRMSKNNCAKEENSENPSQLSSEKNKQKKMEKNRMAFCSKHIYKKVEPFKKMIAKADFFKNVRLEMSLYRNFF